MSSDAGFFLKLMVISFAPYIELEFEIPKACLLFT